ncbi:MAG: AraC family transcriptional regulator [Paludibacterium sp.]|uniref:AraC family transcriptional regulator n=1 Tax=Paludibacterium sp. TaxID=1917523 RepID=UPI0025DE0F66|nr:AraC family transcriptional regulator [Paludibacterium sp.]MBV8047775.1 AraC family transcriptional regulator [Paludibacterium sp.]MBV8648767.1 AraC family transcriptional regulator [Paludibacterium sp.]
MADTLIELVKRYTDTQPGASPFRTAMPGLTLLRADQERHPVHLIYKPALCVVVQGAKWSTFGGRRLEYGPGQALVVSVEMPALSRVVKASPTEPYLGVVVEFDLALLREVMTSLETPPPGGGDIGQGVFVSDFGGPLADCVLRMVRLLATPHAIAMVAPLIQREISYWLLTGPHGGDVAQLALANNPMKRVLDAIHTLRGQFAEPVSIEHLASVAQMSPSAFHRQFKALTAMTPLQYQKQLRLLEARNLMVSGAVNAETAAYRVGYESPSQFSREYARLFGAPPKRDIELLKEALPQSVPQSVPRPGM